jgi:uncharacterized membrane protein
MIDCVKKQYQDAWHETVRSFWAGVLILLPLMLSVGVIWWGFNALTAWVPKSYQTPIYRFFGLILSLAFVAGVGWVTRLMIGKMLYSYMESVVVQVPVLNRIYPFFKEVSQTLLGQGKSGFDRVVMIEYPRKGCFAIAFVTSEGEGEVQAKTNSHIVNLFLPTTPNPTSGYLLMIPKEDVIPLEMTVAEGMKLVISGGSIMPKYNPREPGAPLG